MAKQSVSKTYLNIAKLKVIIPCLRVLYGCVQGSLRGCAWMCTGLCTGVYIFLYGCVHGVIYGFVSMLIKRLNPTKNSFLRWVRTYMKISKGPERALIKGW